MMKLQRKNGKLFAVNESGKFVGQIINEMGGDCLDNSPEEPAGLFASIFEGHGYIYHQADNPPNPFFVKSWGQVFQNPEMLPAGTKNVFVDQSISAEDLFNSVPVR